MTPIQQGASDRPLRLGFAGTPAFAASILAALNAAGAPVQVVYTQPDRPSGRGRRIGANPVKLLAQNLGLAVAQPASLRDPDTQREMARHELDLLIVAAYGLILPQAILETPRGGCINVHASLLPRWRGAAPVERAIMAGDRETGVSIMQMDAGLDTGPVLASHRCPITAATRGPTLEAELAECGAQLLLECLADIDTRTPIAQVEALATYATKLTKADAEVHWDQDACVIDRQIRALCGRLPATLVLGKLRIKLLDAKPDPSSTGAAPGTIVRSDRDGVVVACKPGTLSLQQVQLNVGKASVLNAQAACNGYPHVFAPGTSLVSHH